MLLTSIENELPQELSLSLGLCVCTLKTNSHKLLKEFLIHTTTKKQLSTECVAAFIKHVGSLFHKEKYFSSCMGSAKTSLVESQNHIIFGHLAIGSNLNIEKSIERMMEYSLDKGNQYENISLQNLE